MSDHEPTPEADAHVPLSIEDSNLLEKFHQTDYAAYNNVIAKPTPGTCRWILSHKKFKTWLENTRSSTLWLSGSIGTGKTVLSSFLLEHLKETQDNTVFCSFFFNSNAKGHRTATSGLRSIIHQLLSARIPLLTHARKCLDPEDKLLSNIPALWRLFAEVTADKECGPVVLIVDGLDECDNETRYTFIHYLVRHFSEAAQQARRPFSLKCLVTSRVLYSMVNQSFPSTVVRLDLDDQFSPIEKDIKLYVNHRTKQIDVFETILGQFKSNVVDFLVRRACQSWLWVSMVLDELQKISPPSTPRDLHELLLCLPEELQALYDGLLEKCTDPDKTITILHVVLAATRPLTIAEMACALSTQDNWKFEKHATRSRMAYDLQKHCPLIKVRESRIHLIPGAAEHLTTRSSDDTSGWKAPLHLSESNRVFARLCISYLLLNASERPPVIMSDSGSVKDVTDGIRPNDDGDFLQYAATNWPSLFPKARQDQSLLESASRLFDTGSTVFQIWFEVYWKHVEASRSFPVARWPTKFTDLHAASYTGIETLVQSLVEKGHRVHIEDEEQMCPLHYAARNGHHGAVKLLLTHKAEIEATDNKKQTALHHAASNGHTVTVHVLLSANADTTAQDEHGSTALHCAAGAGKQAVLEALITVKADIEARDLNERTPLHYAASQAELPVVQTLLDSGADANPKDCEQCTPLHCASREGHSAILTTLLMGNADIDARDKNGATALHVAALHGRVAGRVAAVNVLLDSKADLEAKTTAGETALIYAVRHRNTIAVPILLHAGADLSAKELNGDTVLHLAVRNGHETLVRALLDEGADIAALNDAGRTARALAEEIYREAVKKGQQEIETRRKAIIQLLKAKELAQLQLSDEPVANSADVDGRFHAAIVSFSSGHTLNKVTVDKVLCGTGITPLNLHMDGTDERAFRWIHFPANNMRWIEIFLHHYSKGNESLKREMVLRKDLWEKRQHTGGAGMHSRFMRPLCQEIDGNSMTLFMPYIHWETLEKFEDMKTYLSSQEFLSHDGNKPKILAKAYLDPNENHPLHLRRTLDQYYYYMLKNTDKRDKDQAICRFFDREKRYDKKVVLMVDQLWLWILGDTVITSFPERWSRDDMGDPDEYDITDLLESVIGNLSENIQSPDELAEFIIGEALRICLDPTKNTNENLQFLEFYENCIGHVTNGETERFDIFLTAATAGDKNGGDRDHDALDIREEIALVREIKDIQDELHILSMLFYDQRKVLEDMKRVFEKWRFFDLAEEPLNIVQRHIDEVEKMEKHAERTYLALNHLLDLKQKQANVSEARSARAEAEATRKQAEATARQGITIMIFTIVTIIFLPLSFMAAFFAINIAEFPKGPDGLHLSYVSKYMFTITVAIVLPLILLALNVEHIGRTYERASAWINNAYKLRRSISVPIAGRKQGQSSDPAPKASAKGSPFSDKHRHLRLVNLGLHFVFIVLPMCEIYFICNTVPRMIRRFARKTSKGNPMLPNGSIVASPMPNGTCKNDTSHVPGPKLSQEGPSKHRWRLRGWVRDPAVVIIGVLRVILLPLWVTLLCMELVPLLVAFAAAYLFFEHSPVLRIEEWRRWYTWDTLSVSQSTPDDGKQDTKSGQNQRDTLSPV